MKAGEERRAGSGCVEGELENEVGAPEIRKLVGGTGLQRQKEAEEVAEII